MATNGCVIAGTPIAVDIWQVGLTRKCKLFFLTHAHGDHIKGLDSKWSTKFYTSPITAKIVQHKLRIKQDLINILTVGESHILPLGEFGNETVTITVFDANHCPGSVMFLFESGFGRILYTGDFRYDEGIPTNVSELCHDVDQLYLDNTFCNRHFQFPPRSQQRDVIVDIIRKNCNCTVMIGVRSLGKENLLNYIAKCVQTCIRVSELKLQTLRLLGLDDIDAFVSRRDSLGINTVPLNRINPQQVDKWNETHPTIAILPSGWPSPHRHADIYTVPYSDHCSFTELLSFVQHIRPKKVFAIVKNTLPGTADMSVFNEFLNMEQTLFTDATQFSLATNDTAIWADHTEKKSTGTSKKPWRHKKKRHTHFLKHKVQTKGVKYSDNVANNLEFQTVMPKCFMSDSNISKQDMKESSVDCQIVFDTRLRNDVPCEHDGARIKENVTNFQSPNWATSTTNIFGGKRVIFKFEQKKKLKI